MKNLKLGLVIKKKKTTLSQHAPGSNFNNMAHDGVDVLPMRTETNHALFLGGVKDLSM